MSAERKTVVLTGGTDGIGRALAESLRARGDRVVILGRDHRKAATFGGEFITADLSRLDENHRVIRELLARYPVIDALVLCARFYRTNRTETVDGLEENFALFYLSRYLFSHLLRPALERAGRPVIVNAAGPGGSMSLVDWADPQSHRGYDGVRAMFQSGKFNDLLGVTFAATGSPVAYVLYHPSTTATSFAGEYDAETAAYIARVQRQAKPPQAAAAPILDLIDTPPDRPLSAYLLADELPVTGPDYAPAAAERLDQYTRKLLDHLPAGADLRPA